tara:strand:- start:210 stop:614 length:405 start_codon:yes stop_codon:yes gene_type:complete
MSFVVPKVYMIEPMLAWARELADSDSMSSNDLASFKDSVVSHGLSNDDDVQRMLSLLYDKAVDNDLTNTVSQLAVDETEECDNWSDEDAITNELETADVQEHLQHVTENVKDTKMASVAKVAMRNTRRSGRMRC